MLELKGKKLLVVGLGKSGLAAAMFLRHRGAHVTVSDVRSAEALAKDIPALLDEGIMVETGGHGLLTFRRQAGFAQSHNQNLLALEFHHLDRSSGFRDFFIVYRNVPGAECV